MTRAQRMHQLLQQAFQPVHLQLVDDSALHSRGSESHFRLLIVSSMFEGLSLVQRHKRVMQVLESEFQSGLHSISQKTISLQEWAKAPATVPKSSKCLKKTSSNASLGS